MKFRRVPKAIHKALKDEVQEVKALTITDKDVKEAELMTKLIVAVFNSYGVPVPEYIQKAFIIILKYGIRDIKDGCKTHDKFIIKRILNEVNKEVDKENEKSD
jgi:hypothetical protein